MVQVPLKDLQETTPSLDPLPQHGSLAHDTNGQNIEAASDPIVHKHEKRQRTEQSIDWLGAAQGGHIVPEEDEPKQQQDKPKFKVKALAHLDPESIDLLGAAQGGHVMPEEDKPEQQQKKPKFTVEAPETGQPIDWLGAAQGHIMPEEDELKQQQRKPTSTVEAPVTEQPIDWLGAAQGGHIMPETDEPKQQQEKPTLVIEAPVHPGLTKEAQGGKIHKEGEEGKSDTIDQQFTIAATTTVAEFVRTSPSCAFQGLANPNFSRDERFTLGGMADSLYEYLIKVGHLNTII